MKSFADWTQELAESQNHEPEPEADGAEICEGCEGVGAVHQTYSDPVGQECPYCSGRGRVDHVKCRGCDKYGAPNYTGEQYYCGGSPRCCP